MAQSGDRGWRGLEGDSIIEMTLSLLRGGVDGPSPSRGARNAWTVNSRVDSLGCDCEFGDLGIVLVFFISILFVFLSFNRCHNVMRDDLH